MDAAGAGWCGTSFKTVHTDKVFAGLVMVILIGLAVETLLFHSLEQITIRDKDIRCPQGRQTQPEPIAPFLSTPRHIPFTHPNHFTGD